MRKKILNKIIILVLIVSITVCGCTSNKKNIDYNKTKDELSFTGLSDEKLQDYVMDSFYSGMNAKFTNDDYKINDISTIYVSKEYLEELEYNSKSNVYFGFTLDELAEKFEGKKYIFTLGEDNKTTVKEFEKYNDNYKKMIKNVAIGSGVILVCTTVSILSSGTAVSIIFAASAKTASEFAISSAALSGIISSTVEYYKTGNIEKALEKGALEASEGFKWGAIIGGATGGVAESISQMSAAKDLKTMSNAKIGARAEARAIKKYGGREQISYLNGKEVNSSVAGATRPDIVRTVNGKLEAIEVKNYNLNSAENRNNLITELKRQVADRVNNLPKGSKQRIVLDIQGRNYNKKFLEETIKEIQYELQPIYRNIPVDIMA